MGGKGGGGGGGDMEMYSSREEPVGRADPIDLTQNQAYINSQRAAREATAPPPIPPVDTGTGGNTGDVIANSVLAPPDYWGDQSASTLQPTSLKRSSMKTFNDPGSSSGSV